MDHSISFRLKSYVKFAFDKVIGIDNIKLLIRIKTAYGIYKSVNGPAFKSDDAENIIWINYPNLWFFRRNITWDILLMAYVAASGQKFKVHRGGNIGQYRNKNILFNTFINKFDDYRFENYSAIYQFLCQQLEYQGNKVYPSYDEVLYWENKIYMYTKFRELDIHTPRTVFYSDFQLLMQSESAYPFLIKVPHSSGSYGLFNITDGQTLQKVSTDPIILSNKYYIVQERLNITMDLRVICVGDKIEHFYWRKNNDKTKWRTTSTSFGSSVDFETFPEKWRQYIIDTFKKLDLTMGAFDVGWQNDDTETEPYFFEVSPSYDINPRTTNQEHLNSYGHYKKQLIFKDSFDQLFVEQTYDIKRKGVAIFFENLKKNSK